VAKIEKERGDLGVHNFSSLCTLINQFVEYTQWVLMNYMLAN